MPMFDVAFPLLSTRPIPCDHGYHLYAAISRVLPTLHQPSLHPSGGVAIHPIRGHQIGGRELQLSDRSQLVLRVPDGRIGEVIPLAGKQLRLGRAAVRVGVPRVLSLIPAVTLRSRLVTIKHGMDKARFAAELRRKLDHFGVSAKVLFALPNRRTLRIKDKEVVGYEVVLEGLSAEESLTIQENRCTDPSLGWSRQHMGCGVFVPHNEREDRR